MQVQWLGINAFRFVDGEQTIVLDPYVTRQREPLCDPDVVKQYVPTATAMIISHSHWDHLADAHVVALHTGAEVFGSRTTVNVCRSFGVPDSQLVEMAAGDTVARDRFSVRFLASKHVVLDNGTVAYAGTYETPPPSPPRLAPDYLEGGTFAVLLEFGGYRILDIGSANLVEEAIRGLEVDILLLSSGGWQRTPRYLERVFSCVTARWVVPCHHDDFLRPLAAGIRVRDPEGLAELVRRIPELAPATEVVQLGLLESFSPPR
jgi:L-ascorbate metabolism protein UlaG (beta-lactamase superfamily)